MVSQKLILVEVYLILAAVIRQYSYGTHSSHTSMQVFQLGVQLQPSSSDALCHLGNGQLMQYDATNEEHWLVNAERSFRASIDMEGKAIIATLIPEQLAAQDWWKKQKAATASQGKPAEAKKPTTGTSSQKQAASTSAAKQTTGAAARGKPGQPARAQPSGGGGGGKTAAKPVTSRGPTGLAARKTTGSGPAASRQTSGPAKAGQKGGAAATGNMKGAATASGGGKSVATLGELKSGVVKKPSNGGGGGGTTPSTSTTSTAPETKTDISKTAAVTEAGKAEVNKKSYQPRLGLARTLAKTSDQKKHEESHGFYREVIAMAPQVHDAYIELGEMLAKTDPVAAVDVYAKFPFNDPPTFDDAFLHGEIVRLLMKGESYDNPHLCTSLIAMGKALGIGVLEKQVSILENKFQSKLLKQVYAGVHGKPIDDPELQAFFKFKCWL